MSGRRRKTNGNDLTLASSSNIRDNERGVRNVQVIHSGDPDIDGGKIIRARYGPRAYILSTARFISRRKQPTFRIYDGRVRRVFPSSAYRLERYYKKKKKRKPRHNRNIVSDGSGGDTINFERPNRRNVFAVPA